MDEQFEDVKPETGLMIVKGPNGCRYLDDLEKQKAYIQDGWNKSGDLCRIDDDGYFYYEARTDDMILTGGYNVSGLEVEAVLLEHPTVHEAAVVGTPDKDRGQIVKAFIIPKDAGSVGEETVSRVAGFRKIADICIQVSAVGGVRRRTTANRDRQNPARRPAPAGV